MVRLFKNVIPWATLALICACGKAPPEPDFSKKIRPEVLPLDGSNIDGLYMAKFKTLNPHVNGTIAGSATLLREGNRLFAYVRIFGGGPNVWHQQFITQGKRCPSLKDDFNKDGFIDIEEATKVWGEIFIPLDADIGSQLAGKNIYPVADEAGSYFYERVTSFNRLFDDLKKEDPNFHDNISKLALDEGLAIEGRVAVVLGTSSEVVFPETVARSEIHKPHQTLPITCGVFKRVTKIPGTIEEEEIPGPTQDPQTDEGEMDLPESPREDDNWTQRIIDWWRSRWNGWRRGRGILRWAEG